MFGMFGRVRLVAAGVALQIGCNISKEAPVALPVKETAVVEAGRLCPPVVVEDIRALGTEDGN